MKAMLSHLNLARKLFFRGTEIGKYLLSPKLSERIKKIKGSVKHPFSFLGITLVILFIILLVVPFLRFLPEEENFPLRGAFPEVFLESQDPFLSPVGKFLTEPPFLLVEKNSLQAAIPPFLVSPRVLGALIAGYEPVEGVRREIKEYIIQSGDTLSSLAERFGISLNTILWANDLTERSIISLGDKLIIPPVSGVIHRVKAGDTLSEIARTYRVRVEEIVAFNELSNEDDIFIGDILVIPGGVKPLPLARVRPTPSNLVPSTGILFIVPVSSPYVITQGLHWYNAVDFSYPGYACGKPVFAAAGGTVQKIGYGRYYGNYLRILHPNGVVTLYAHFSGITVRSGEKVNVGQIIGYIGNTGRTKGPTGCHLHFEVRGARNPFVR